MNRVSTSSSNQGAVVLTYPLRGAFRARNSPARRVPSHGTHLMGTTYAIDFIPVDSRGRSTPWRWRALTSTEARGDFIGFGATVLVPSAGAVVIAHDGEEDHDARRSQLALVAYAAGQAQRIRGGPGAIAGNHVVIALGDGGPFALVAHLREGSLVVGVGDVVEAGQRIGQCGTPGTAPTARARAGDRQHRLVPHQGPADRVRSRAGQVRRTTSTSLIRANRTPGSASALACHTATHAHQPIPAARSRSTPIGPGLNATSQRNPSGSAKYPE